MTPVYERVARMKRTLGTDWPVVVAVTKNPKLYRTSQTWTAAVVCNGIAWNSATFATRRAAIEWAENIEP